MDLEEMPDRVGPYRIEERLGAGGMGEVYRAYDQRLDRRVALKHIRPERREEPKARERFLREARVAARLNHPALVHVHDILEEEGLWIVMELVEGDRLDQLLARGGPFPLREGLELARQITSGLAAIHAAGILHRDLKTQNVIITPAKSTASGEIGLPPRARILDFGLARTDGDSSLSAAGDLLGTPRAMSPEQARGEEVDQLSDLFSLGTLLYEMFTGRPPFRGPGALETLGQICHLEPDPITDFVPELPMELSGLIERLLAKEASGRPKRAEEVAEELDRLASLGEGSGARPVRALPTDAPEGDRVPAEPRSDSFRRHGERRQLTVLCCELVKVRRDGAAESLDPESLYAVLPRFKAIVDQALRRFGGYLGDFQGHRLVVYLGYPQAFEDAGRRAVLTALEIVSRASSLTSGKEGSAGGPELAARGGVHTGPSVILTPEGQGERVSLGPTLDLARGILDSAAPGQVLLSPVSQGLVKGLFVEEQHAAIRVAGSAEPLPLTRIVKSLDVQSRVESAELLAPIVGRNREMDLLADRFRAAREGAGQAVLITGNAGIGKTRLLRGLKERLMRSGARWIVTHGSRYESRELYPIAALLRQVFVRDAGAGKKAPANWTRSLEALEVPGEEVGPLLDSLVALEEEESRTLTQQEQISATGILPDLLLEIADRSPGPRDSKGLVVVFEDLQWADTVTLELVDRLIEGCTAAPLFLLLTCRPSFRVPLKHRNLLTQLSLRPLGTGDSAALVESLAEGVELAGARVASVLSRADGVPLYLEELTREALSTSGSTESQIPPTLNDALADQLDRLGTAKAVAQLAAVLGTSFRLQELRARCAFDPEALDSEIERLLDAGILEFAGPRPQEIMRFGNSLTHEATLASLIEQDRALLGRESE